MAINKPGRKILVTGLPGSGKTTLVENIINHFRNRAKMAGFITREIREKGQRCGFELISLDGSRAVLSRVDLRTPFRVGKYRVDLQGFENFLDRIPFSEPEIDLVILDEIGKMECLSAKFRELVLKMLNGQASLLATIAYYGTPFIEKIKSRQNVEVFKLSGENREMIQQELILRLKAGLEP